MQNVGSYLDQKAQEADAAKTEADRLFKEANTNPNLTDEQRQRYRDQALAYRDQARAIDNDWGAGGTYRQIATALVAAASGNISASNAAFVQNMVVNYVQQQGAGYIGQLVKEGELTEGSPLHAALHAIVGCAGAAASSQSCSAGALGGSASSVIAGLFNEADPNETREQREAKRNLITSLVTGIAAMSDGQGAATANSAATANVDNNWLATQQIVQMHKELGEAKTPLEKALVLGKWAGTSVKQDVLTSGGIGLGLAQGGMNDVEGMAAFLQNPVAGLQSMYDAVSDPAIAKQIGEEAVKSLQASIERMQYALQVGGDEQAVQLGKDLGQLIYTVGSVVTGVGGAAKAGVTLAKVGVEASTEALGKFAGKTTSKIKEEVSELDKRTRNLNLASELTDGETTVFPDRNVKPSKPIVEIDSGGKGDWSKELNNPKPDTIYRVDGNKEYVTDSQGRVSSVEADLSAIKRDRNTYQQCKVGKCGLDGDEGGHLIASILDGPGERLNIVPMDGNLNKGVWRSMEKVWGQALDEGRSVSVKIKPIYSDNTVRPEKFNIEYSVGGNRPVEIVFYNRPGGFE